MLLYSFLSDSLKLNHREINLPENKGILQWIWNKIPLEKIMWNILGMDTQILSYILLIY